MTTTALDIFHGTVQKTNEWLRELMAELEWDEPQRAYTALRAVLHALRDRLTVEEAAQLAAQMPMLIRGFYFEGWKPAGKPERIRRLDEFLAQVEHEWRRDIGEEPERVVRAVFAVLSRRLSPGEIADVVQLLPQELRALWPGEGPQHQRQPVATRHAAGDGI